MDIVPNHQFMRIKTKSPNYSKCFKSSYTKSGVELLKKTALKLILLGHVGQASLA